MYSLRFAAHSEVGRIRKNNQDAGYASPNILVVTDGMGGAAAGDLASAVASLEVSKSDQRATDGEEMLERIAGMIARANTKLTHLIEDDLELDGMGTTFCGAMFSGTQFGLAHIGDSRGYLLRDGELTQLTHDHSWVQSLIDEGRLTPEQAATHPHRSLILKVLNGQVNFAPDLEVIDARLGDRIMFCSDGLSGLVDHDVLHEYLQLDDAEAAIEQLTQAANDNGGHDNITIIIGDVVEQDDELDQREGVLLGSATEVTIPAPGAKAGEASADAVGYPAAPPPASPSEQDEAEVARYAPQESKRRWPGILAMVLGVLLVLGIGAWAVIGYAGSRYFVAEQEGHVAIYNGLPGAFLGIQLHALVEMTDIPIGDLPPYYGRVVTSTIQVPNADAAQATVAELRIKATRCREVRQEREQRAKPPLVTASPSPTPRPSGSTSATPPGLPLGTASPSTTPSSGGTAPTSPGFVQPTVLESVLASVTPTAAEEADPEEC